MEKPRINNENWAITRTHVDGYGEELWTLSPKDEKWIAVIHVQQNGKMYLSIIREKRGAKKVVNQETVVEALNQLSQWIYEQRGILAEIGVPAQERNAKLFSTVRKAGFRKTQNKLRVRKRPNTIIFRYVPDQEKDKNVEEDIMEP
ncbi:MAG: hypothetical protein IKE91_02220 [Clostridia bacterium]|nr:hypothetical protein [Clostridia bacterium]